MLFSSNNLFFLWISTCTTTLLSSTELSSAWILGSPAPFSRDATRTTIAGPPTAALSNNYLEGDLVAILVQPSDVTNDPTTTARLCVVRDDGSVVPLCTRQDDVETDLFADPRQYSNLFWQQGVTDELVQGTYGEGFYGQRPVPSLGGGPGYGADADEVWSVTEDTLQRVRDDQVDVPVLDMGIAHGEKARGGSF
jgi:hypothetical protein